MESFPRENESITGSPESAYLRRIVWEVSQCDPTPSTTIGTDIPSPHRGAPLPSSRGRPIWSPADRHHARLEQTSGRLVFPSADTNHGALGVASGGVGRHAHGGVSIGDHGSGGHRGAHVSGVRVPRVHGVAVSVHVEKAIDGRVIAHVLPRSGVTSAHRGPHDRAIIGVNGDPHGRGGASLATARGSGRQGAGYSGEVSGADEALSVRGALSGDSQAMHTEA